MTSSTYAQWEGLRELVRSRVGDALQRQVPELRLTPIDLAALTAAKPWRAAQAVGWEWPAVIKRRRANRFDLAIWHGEICAASPTVLPTPRGSRSASSKATRTLLTRFGAG